MKQSTGKPIEIMLGRRIIRHSGATLGPQIMEMILGGVGLAALDELPKPLQDILVGPAGNALRKRLKTRD